MVRDNEVIDIKYFGDGYEVFIVKKDTGAYPYAIYVSNRDYKGMLYKSSLTRAKAYEIFNNLKKEDI